VDPDLLACSQTNVAYALSQQQSGDPIENLPRAIGSARRPSDGGRRSATSSTGSVLSEREAKRSRGASRVFHAETGVPLVFHDDRSLWPRRSRNPSKSGQALWGTRTPDPFLTMEVLYRLS
jgi:hypothetical protein